MAPPGGRSTHGVCTGVLSWLVEHGAVDAVDLSGLPVALALRYNDDEPGSLWTRVLYLDSRGTAEQRAALEAIFTGRLGGDAATHFPWTWVESELVAVGHVAIDADHTRRRQRLRIRGESATAARASRPSEVDVTYATVEAPTLAPTRPRLWRRAPGRRARKRRAPTTSRARDCSSGPPGRRRRAS